MNHLLTHLLENVVSLLAGVGLGIYLYRRYAGSILEQVKQAASQVSKFQ
jgi:uncharacterized protein YneF (UPF0154 family)